MSYVVSIRRRTAVTVDELRAIVDNDDELRILEGDSVPAGTMTLEWQDERGSRAEMFVLSDGVIDATTPSSAALAKLQSLAAALGAKVIGEEGEDLTDVEIGDDVPGGCGLLGWTIVFLATLVTAYWWFR